MTNQRLERHRIDIICLDAFHDLVIKIDGLIARQA